MLYICRESSNINIQMKEVFKKHPIHNLEISNLGRVKGKRVKYLKPIKNNGYYMVTVNCKTCNWNHGKKQKRIHRLVVETFIGCIPKGYCVNHKDGDKLNNNLKNLEIVTYQENTLHAYKNKLARGRYGEKNGCSKLKDNDIIEIYNMIILGKTNLEISKHYDIHKRYVSLLRHGKRWNNKWKLFFKTAPISNGNVKLPISFMLEVIKECEGFKTNMELSKEFKLNPSTISRIRNQKTWKGAWEIYNINATTIENTLINNGSE